MAKNANNLYNRAFRQKIINLDEGSLGELVGTLTGDAEVKVVENTKETYHVIIPTSSSAALDLNNLGNVQAAGCYTTLSTICSSVSTASTAACD